MILFIVYVCVCILQGCMCVGQRKTCESEFYPSNMCALGTELWMSGLIQISLPTETFHYPQDIKLRISHNSI